MKKDNEAPLIHWKEINDQPRWELRFQSRILPKQRGIEVKWVTALDLQASKKAEKARKQSIKS